MRVQDLTENSWREFSLFVKETLHAALEVLRQRFYFELKINLFLYDKRHKREEDTNTASSQ